MRSEQHQERRYEHITVSDHLTVLACR
jgi:hypothetical protein